MAASPCELVFPIDDRIIPNKITSKTSHRMPSATLAGDMEDEMRKVMEFSWV